MTSLHARYRLLVWLPLGLLVLVAALVHGAGLRPPAGLAKKGVQLSLAALVYGGIPYAALAAWATWWIGGRSEREIQRLMLLAPLLYAALFSLLAALIGVAVGDLRVFLAVALLGAAASLALGYGFVGLAWLYLQAVKPDDWRRAQGERGVNRGLAGE